MLNGSTPFFFKLERPQPPSSMRSLGGPSSGEGDSPRNQEGSEYDEEGDEEEEDEEEDGSVSQDGTLPAAEREGCCKSFEVVVRAPWQLRRATSREAGRRVLLVHLERRRLLHVSPSSGRLIKAYDVSSIVSTDLLPPPKTPGQVVVRLARARSKTKRWRFHSHEEAVSFRRWLKLLQDHGQQVVSLFQALDGAGVGRVAARDLVRAAADVQGLVLLEADVEAMVRLATRILPQQGCGEILPPASPLAPPLSASDGLRLRHFFHLHLHLQARRAEAGTDPWASIESCLRAWHRSASDWRREEETAAVAGHVIDGLMAGEVLLYRQLPRTLSLINYIPPSRGGGGYYVRGSLIITTYQIRFRADDRDGAVTALPLGPAASGGGGSGPAVPPLLSLPLAAIAEIREEPVESLALPSPLPGPLPSPIAISSPSLAASPVAAPAPPTACLAVATRDGLRVARFVFEGAGEGFIANLVEVVSRVAFSERPPFSYLPPPATEQPPPPPTPSSPAPPDTPTTSGKRGHWGPYSFENECRRLGLLPPAQSADDGSVWPWRVLDQTPSWWLCPTYPDRLLIPSALTDDDVAQAAAFRSRQRLPVVTWRDVSSGAVLVRSAQPMAGVGQARSSADERLLNLYRCRGVANQNECSPAYPELCILDCRRPIAAMGNQLQGKGVENPANYTHTKLVFGHMDNIHAVRSSLEAVVSLMTPAPESGREEGWEAVGHYRRLDDSRWLSYLRLMIKAALTVVDRIAEQGCSVLVHCSDGWDRTAQVSALAQLLLDPHYRTLDGFAGLVEKEWGLFGYKFHDRAGRVAGAPSERSPIFLQWLDAVHQLLRQLPQEFEFSECVLLYLADHVHSGLFGDFRGNCVRERSRQLRVEEGSVSLWSTVLPEPSRRAFLNPHYRSPPPSSARTPLRPCFSLKKLCLWEALFHRIDPTLLPPTPPPPPDAVPLTPSAWLDFSSGPVPATPHQP